MRRLLVAVAALMLMTGVAFSQDLDQPAGEHTDGGLGFHNVEAPVGIRWWFSEQKVGLDLGLGFGSTPSFLYSDESLTNFALDIGVPFVVKSWSRVHVLIRPGILYQSQEVETTSPPASFDSDNATTLDVTGEIEAEVFLVPNFSVSASHGIGFRSFSPAGGGDSRTSFGTLGGGWTDVGFHIYFFGGHD